ncbi:MAG: hypothetical protein V3U82_00980 [Robiginitomaculum sp.]
MRNLQVLILSGAAASLSACASTAPVLKANSRMAVKANIAAQAIAPDADQKANRHIPQNRALREAARKRYEAGEVRQPKVQKTN